MESGDLLTPKPEPFQGGDIQWNSVEGCTSPSTSSRPAGAVSRILLVVIGRWKRAIFVEAGRMMSRENTCLVGLI
jgi:hypothetical protein